MGKMAIMKWPWSLTGTLLASTYLHSLCAAATPSINVALKTSFSSAPYLLELLETAADQNATAYYPLLDKIADGYFAETSTDQELYELFMKVLEEDGHLLNPEALSTYKFALSMRSAAPRIEAHYQYYHTAVEPVLKENDSSCPLWILFNGQQYCSPSFEKVHGVVSGSTQCEVLQFDRVLGNISAPAAILYADITSPTFGQFHKTLSKTAGYGKTSYRIRHRKSLTAESNPLIIPGYGVELALKRTDYIVIDDRENQKSLPEASATNSEVKFEDEDFADLKPLSTSQLRDLSVKASSFIVQSEEPFDALVKLSQDFPKYSSALASHNASADFIAEHEYNRALLVPAGYNVWWMNGFQLTERQIDGLTLLDILKKERTLVNAVRNLGFKGSEAIDILAHPNISTATAEDIPQRFDWRDEIEGGNVLIWMNDIEKDKRYAGWPTPLTSMLQRVYPGQLPSVRRDCFNLVLTADLTDMKDVRLLAETLLSFVKRKLAIRIGFVPATNTEKSTQQAKVVYHLFQTYGLSAIFAYLEDSYATKSVSAPSSASFEKALEGRTVRGGNVVRTLDEVLQSDTYATQIQGSEKWIQRLSAGGRIPTMFVDGVAIARDEDYLQALSTRVSADLQLIQQSIFKEDFAPDAWLPSYFLSEAATKRNALIVPEDEKSLRFFDVGKLATENLEAFEIFPRIEVDDSTARKDWAHMTVIADLGSDAGMKLLKTAIAFRETAPAVELLIIPNPASTTGSTLTRRFFDYVIDNGGQAFGSVSELSDLLIADEAKFTKQEGVESEDLWKLATPLIESLSLRPGQNAILLNGRLVGPIPDSPGINVDDLEQLVSYEQIKRISPAYAAIEAMSMEEYIHTPLVLAKLSSITALAFTSDKPPGIHEESSLVRMYLHTWKSSHTVIETGDKETATIQMTLVLDPASETGQRWVPILKVISELEGVYVKIYLNPKERLGELPVKRFYRYVLESAPTFDASGALQTLGASFSGVPQEALLTVGLDIPSSWLVAPKVSVHDLDNIKLSSTKTDVDALYELEYILIEGHSREMPGSAAPRGVQLVLGTERDPHFADTIIMANLGYFQFKANPGFYRIDLQEGPSSEIFNIDSIGSLGYHPVLGDEATEVVLMSFQGATLYPRVSRKPGMEKEDVLEVKSNSPMGFVSRGVNFAQSILGKSKDVAAKEVHADINIFSVASGHLYERMLNIMMVSVMRHTKHTVKFWFIEQFLSPSFKDFIPYLAAEYGFEYEMVTYKWPHWLRAQTEKQREIWGYKILFLDVLFPLSLDKVIFVDADQIVRTDMIDLVNHDLKGAPYGFTPMCDSRVEMEGFRFWKQGYWEKFLRGLPYHISALYVVDLQRFRTMAAGDRLRQQYHQLSADPNSLSNLDQDLPNHMQAHLPIHSLPQEWLWCETWCSDESLKDARTIDLCNNPQTKEPKLDRARRQVPEWTVYDDDIAAVDKKRKGQSVEKNPKSQALEATTASTKKDEL
ncbi:UDP-glucose:glycoprotein glucosyltransferase-domain-containing protein [Calycina marina]|uniref:UDP-glucose:glycoprotein glucosyltransferase-domain-containing protein n=1 Tax=Calycina marina TaxID=1763456 RepID=A0A9P7Z5J5_9HELO|nr:UDP-glucose:glycoprotein glucosyltransferase-domain-containing protein [Calycina marina]